MTEPPTTPPPDLPPGSPGCITGQVLDSRAIPAPGTPAWCWLDDRWQWALITGWRRDANGWWADARFPSNRVWVLHPQHVVPIGSPEA